MERRGRELWRLKAQLHPLLTVTCTSRSTLHRPVYLPVFSPFFALFSFITVQSSTVLRVHHAHSTTGQGPGRNGDRAVSNKFYTKMGRYREVIGTDEHRSMSLSSGKKEVPSQYTLGTSDQGSEVGVQGKWGSGEGSVNKHN